MPLHLYNTLSRRLEPFSPLHPERVTIYACGVTVYDYCHLGHARSYVAWDVLRRYLMFLGYHVHYVQNFTDIDDKILRRAHENGETMATVSDRYIAAYHEDMAALNILPATAYPRATEVIPEIIHLIQGLLDRGYAYVAGGDVYYAVAQFPSYGKLSGRQLEQLMAGASGRIEEEEEQRKRHPLDFALWKAAKREEMAVYEPWEAPWGKGRPGWHIECSAMVRQAFGATVDIHCGGMDLIFPHHENEIAQSEAVTQQPLARFWLHNGFVTVNAAKMSKSLGNFTTIRDLLAQGVHPMALRLLVLQAQYRKPLDFTPEALTAAAKGWQTLQEALQLNRQLSLPVIDPEAVKAHPSTQAFCQAMDEDLNTAAALAVIFELAKTLNREQHRYLHGGDWGRSPAEVSRDWHTLVALAQVLGLEAKEAPKPSPTMGLTDEEIQNLIAARTAARQAKNYAESDRLRDLLLAQGVKLVDQKDGTTHWFRVPAGSTP
ncbi:MULTISPECIES: cysteine--tRNA ligase [unclassified Thermosynechococcus]|uniref:cysteine--tRNA ligase n=1 Tax=unclassified Thermosynechococcus TaxID=2622553 RepID=UPI00168102D4|nr:MULTISPECIES: cysteine--tRNA ligase [unclassified Thermosynechococcus]WKT82819.1 cysteine--tRNA ligase [Thermosynechococcus sp. HY596]WNC61946.1 cysteine--tRNA ligase [Thermosynechococcus sp. HY591]WNC64500.1 cysteine--tRNA ligase [Thermosynechococcus sp. HY593]